MVTVASGLICAYLVGELVVPAIRNARALEMERRREKVYHLKLRLVRKYYTELSELTYSEIVEQYDVDALWDNIGTHPRRTVTFLDATTRHQ
jgi:hypothetical protein